jgi:hypothetical protein
MVAPGVIGDVLELNWVRQTKALMVGRMVL